MDLCPVLLMLPFKWTLSPLHIHHSTSKCSSGATGGTLFPAVSQVLSHLHSLCPKLLSSVPVTPRRLSVVFWHAKVRRKDPLLQKIREIATQITENCWVSKNCWDTWVTKKSWPMFCFFCTSVQNIPIGLNFNLLISAVLKKNILILWKTSEFSVCLPKYKISIFRT